MWVELTSYLFDFRNNASLYRYFAYKVVKIMGKIADNHRVTEEMWLQCNEFNRNIIMNI